MGGHIVGVLPLGVPHGHNPGANQPMQQYTTIGLHADSDVTTRLSTYRDDNELRSMHDAIESLLEESGY